MKKLSLAALLALSTLGTVSAVHASDVEVTGNVGATSNYIWRGMTQTRDDASVNGGVDVGYNGFYAGAWASNVDFTTNSAEYELDGYVGYGNSIGDVTYDLSYVKYMYPDANADADFDEVIFALGYTIGDLTLGASYAKTVYEEWIDGSHPRYVEGTASYDFKIFSLDLSYGDYEKNAALGDNYTVGLSKTLEVYGQSFDVAVVYAEYDADTGSADDQNNLFATISYSF
jgi:uncharacterized protein (TIGR02001 family)